MKKKFIIFLSILICLNIEISAQVTKGELPEGTVTLIDGFENGNYWIWAGSDYDQWGTHKYSAGARISKKWASEGTHSLACKVEPMPGTTGWYDGLWFYDGNQNFSGVKYIAVDVYNPMQEGILLSLILQVTDKWLWKQSDFFWISPGVRTVVFDVTKYDEFLDNVKRIQIQLGTNTAFKQYETFYIDNLRIIK